MHYFWMKKKWFYDIIVNNLLFAFIVAMSPHDVDIDVDVGYAEVAPFKADISDVSKDIDVNIDGFDFLTTSEFGFTSSFYWGAETEITFLEPPITSYPFALDIIGADHYLKDIYPISFQILTTYSFGLETIRNEFYDLEVAIPGDIDYVIPFDPSTVVSNQLYFDEIADDLVLMLDFTLTSSVEFKKRSILIDATPVQGLHEEIEINLNNYDFAFDFTSLTGLHPKFSDVVVSKYNTNVGFYVCPVLQLNTSNIQFKKIDVSCGMEVVSYVTRFSDLEGLIVVDLTGKKFKDLRNLMV